MQKQNIKKQRLSSSCCFVRAKQLVQQVSVSLQHVCCSSCSHFFPIFLHHLLQNTCRLFCFVFFSCFLFFFSCFLFSLFLFLFSFFSSSFMLCLVLLYSRKGVLVPGTLAFHLLCLDEWRLFGLFCLWDWPQNLYLSEMKNQPEIWVYWYGWIERTKNGIMWRQHTYDMYFYSYSLGTPLHVASLVC